MGLEVVISILGILAIILFFIKPKPFVNPRKSKKFGQGLLQ